MGVLEPGEFRGGKRVRERGLSGSGSGGSGGMRMRLSPVVRSSGDKAEALLPSGNQGFAINWNIDNAFFDKIKLDIRT